MERKTKNTINTLDSLRAGIYLQVIPQRGQHADDIVWHVDR